MVPHQEELKTWSRERRPLIQMWSSLKIENGLLCRWCIDGCSQHLQLVLPSVLTTYLKSPLVGHLGENTLMNLVQERYYWPGRRENVKEWCKASRTCST